MQKKSHAFSCIPQVFLIISRRGSALLKGIERTGTLLTCKHELEVYCKAFSRKEDSGICEQRMMSCS